MTQGMTDQNSLMEIKNIKQEVLEELFQFIYTGKVNEVEEETVCDLLIVAEKYNIKGLKVLTEDTKCVDLSEFNAIKYLNLAITNNAKKLKESAMNLISLKLEEFTKNPELQKFMKLHSELTF